MSLAPLDVLAAGCVFPSGPGMALAGTALNTGLAIVRKHPFYVDRCGRPVRVSAFPDRTLGMHRWCELADAALRDLQQSLPDQSVGTTGEIACWLLLPGAGRPVPPEAVPGALMECVRQAYPSVSSIHCLTGGHAVAATALVQIGPWLERRPHAMAIVLAVECPMDAETLAWLEDQDLLHGAHRSYEGRARANPYGRIPGEGAVALALSASHKVTARPAWARLLACASAQESALRGDDRPCIGAGLTQAARTALEHAARHLGQPQPSTPEAFVGQLTTDLNGEPYRADELGFTWLRLGPWLSPECERLTPALATGDLGCGSAAAHIALAAHELQRQPGREPHLILSSSDDTLRSAFVLASLPRELT